MVSMYKKFTITPSITNICHSLVKNELKNDKHLGTEGVFMM
jgi:hypothetical protein